MRLESLYDVLFDDNKIYAVNKRNELFVCSTGDFEPINTMRYEGYSQLGPVDWDGNKYLKGMASVHLLCDDFQLKECWRHERLMLLSGGRVLERDGGWKDKVIKTRCFDVVSGKLLWNIDSDCFRFYTAAKDLLLASGSGNTYQQSVDIKTGALQWRFEPEGGKDLRLNSVGDTWLLLQSTTHADLGADAAKLYKLDKKTGKVIWEREVPFVDFKHDQLRDCFIGFSNGRLSILDGATGKTLVDKPDAAHLGRAPRQHPFKVTLNPKAGKLAFDVSSEKTVIGVYDYVNQHTDWLSPFAKKGTIRVGRLWYSEDLIHILDSTNTLRVGRNEGDHLQML